MHITIIGKGMEVSEYLKDMAEKQAHKMAKYFPDGTQMQITLSIQHSKHIAEITIPYKNGVVRAEEVTGDMYASIGNALKKIERQIIKHREKLADELKTGFNIEERVYGELEAEEVEGEIVKTKVFKLEPMDIEEAINQLELIDHPFFVFKNSETGDINVLYMRHDGNYGIIIPEGE